MTFADFAPAAYVFLPQLDEENWSLVLVFPFDGKYFPLISVNLDDGARPQDGVHGVTGEELSQNCGPLLSRVFPSSFHSSMTTRK